MNELTTQLEQARQEIAEKEAESRAWEERAAGLSQQLKEERSTLEVSLQILEYLHIMSSHCIHIRRSWSCRGNL